MEKATIRNECLAVTVNHRGAELCSIRDAAGIEYIWQADPAIWGSHAPILFPIVGQVAGGTYTLGGRKFQMKQHGCVRSRRFDLVDRGADFFHFALSADAGTRAQYPFEFQLDIVYRLTGHHLVVQYEVRNKGDEAMPFSIGAHPGFSCAWPDGGNLEDYFLEFECAETARRWFIESGLLAERTEEVFKGGHTITLTPTLFKDGALIFKGLKSAWIALCSRRTSRRITVECAGFPFMGIWAMPGAPYVCIEPWYGHGDPVGFCGDFTEKPGIHILPQGKKFACRHTIGVAVP